MIVCDRYRQGCECSLCLRRYLREVLADDRQLDREGELAKAGETGRDAR